MEYSIEAFVDRLIVEKGMETVPEDIQEQLKIDLRERVEDMVNATILSKIPEEKLSDFEQLLESGSDAEVQNFCTAHIDNFESIIANALMQFRAKYLQLPG